MGPDGPGGPAMIRGAGRARRSGISSKNRTKQKTQSLM